MFIQSKYVEVDPVRQAIAEQHALRIIHDLVVGRPVDALASIQRCRADLEEAGMPLTRATSLQDLFADRHDSNRALNIIEEKLGAWRLGDLLEVEASTIARIPGIGGVELAKVIQAIIYRLPKDRPGD